ncbi:MAG TPA: hypothetical protein VMU02_04165 [bacterium]|nr:hypothetical protein [bacterium]
MKNPWASLRKHTSVEGTSARDLSLDPTGKHLGISEIGLTLVYLGLGMASAFVWTRIADLQAFPTWHSSMIGGTALAPNQYRMLTPWIAEILSRAMRTAYLPLPYFLVRGLVTGVTLICFDRYLRRLFLPAAAAAGAMFLAAIIPFTFFRVVQESDPINLLVFILAFWALAAGRDLLLIPIVLVGTLNRETTLMLPAVYMLARWGDVRPRQLVLRTALLVACWAGVYGALIAGYGIKKTYVDMIMVGRNLGSWRPPVHVALLFGMGWVLAFVGRSRAPNFLKRTIWLVPPYIIFHYVTAIVLEVRLFLPLAPIVIPLSIMVLFPETTITLCDRSVQAMDRAAQAHTEHEDRACSSKERLD